MVHCQDQRPIIVSGPSGVGKGTLIARLLERHPDTFVTTVSHTTRQPRPGEKDGESYHFIQTHEFESLIKKNAFIESTLYSGNYYGTSRQTIKDQQAKGRIAVLHIEVNGVINIKKDQGLDVRCVFIAPPSLQVLEDRLKRRGAESEASVQGRLAQARIETVHTEMAGLHDLVIINKNLEDAFREFEDWALGVVKSRVL